MFKIKFLITIIILSILTLPTFAIEDVIQEERSSNMTERDDYTGETFFRSKFELMEEREAEVKRQRAEYDKEFRPYHMSRFRVKNKTMPPLKKLRMKIYKSYSKNKDQNVEQKMVDSNGVEVEEENEVLIEEAAETQAMIRCKTLKYLPEENSMEATGNVHIVFPNQNSTLYADRMTFDNINKIIQLYDNVKIVSEGNEVLGDYLKINLNDESSFLKNPRASQYKFTISAENGYMFGDTIISENGKIKSDNDNFVELRSTGFGTHMTRMIIPEDEKSFLVNETTTHKYVMKVNEINISSKGYHDKIQLKHPTVYSSTGKKVLALPSMTFYTNKEHDYFEGNFPEIGSYSGFGMFAGPGLVLEAPFGSTVKLIPTINHKSKLGFGGIAKFKSGTNITDIAYNSAVDRVLVKGYQRLDDHLFLQYGMNSYLDDWFMGKNWLGYGGELLYEKGYRHKSFFNDNSTMRFRHRVSAGFLRENEKNRSDKYYSGYHKMGTARFKYMAEIDQRIYSMFGEKDTTENNGWKQFDISLIGQASTALYGTGDTQFIGRIGPRITTQYKFWRQELGYYLSGFSDNTPMTTLDAYRYGTSNIYLREYLRLHKYLTLGLYGSYNLSNDLYDYQFNRRSALREAAFYVALGPDDLKLNLGYDVVRQNTYFGVSMAMNTKGSTVEYKRLKIENPSELGKVKGEINDLGYGHFVAPPSPYRSKAIVEDLEDASTIMKGENL